MLLRLHPPVYCRSQEHKTLKFAVRFIRKPQFPPNDAPKKPKTPVATNEKERMKVIQAAELLKHFSEDHVPNAYSSSVYMHQKKLRGRQNVKDHDKQDLRKELILTSSEVVTTESDSLQSKNKFNSESLLKKLKNMSITNQAGVKNKAHIRHNRKLPLPAEINMFPMSKIPVSTSCQMRSINNTVFDTVEDLQASLTNSCPPLNQFDEWIQLTMEGKLWKFPIDNEQGWDEELSTMFHEHMMLDEYLGKDQMTCGPVDNFMELVCHGLAQNPHYTTTQKQEHLKWFKEYFSDKIPYINSLVTDELKMAKLEKEARGQKS